MVLVDIILMSLLLTLNMFGHFMQGRVHQLVKALRANRKASGSNPTECLTGFRTQPRHKAPENLPVESVTML